MAGDAQGGPSPLSNYIRGRRRSAGLSQAALAARADISLAGLRDVEQGRVLWPRPATLRRLAAALGLSTMETTDLIRFARDDSHNPQDIRIQLLGPLQIAAGPAMVDLGSPKRRELLALLALSPGVPVPRDQLVDLLWGTPNAAQLLQSHVSRLRARLGAYPVQVVAAGGGYLLDVTVDQLDLLTFRQILARARRLMACGEREEAVRRYREAVAMWRGEPLADLPALQAHPALIALGREKRACIIEYADAGAPHDETLTVLRPLAEADPLDEAVGLRLMAALVGTGQRAAALAAYHAMRRRLREDLGVDPAPELERLYRELLGVTADSAAQVLEQLPLAPRGFSGRAGKLAGLDGLLAGWTGATPLICAISGMAGVGKSALAVHWAHAVKESFSDGQLYVDLRGFDPARPVMSSGEVVRLFLEALQPSERMATTPHAQVARYRSLMAGRRMLIVLDNARDAEQVRPILPAAPGSMVLVTSRDQLAGLAAAEGAHLLNLDVLAVDEAHVFLASRLGTQRVAAEGQAAAEIIERCGRLPLALAVVAARAAAHPGFLLAALAAELRGAHAVLSALEVDDRAADVREAFAYSYLNLGEASARMFRLLALHPGPEISVAAAASLTGMPMAVGRRRLRELAGAHLLEEPSPGRFRFHDLLRAYAHELVRASESEMEQASALQRMFGHYLHAAVKGSLLLAPRRDRIALAPGATEELLADHRDALAWFEVEYPVLLAIIDIATDPYRWQLGWALTTYQDRAGHWQDWAEVQEKALRAAERSRDRLGVAHSQRGYGRALAWLRRPDAALAALRRAIELFTEFDDPATLGHLELDLSDAYEQDGRPDLALDHAERSVAFYERAGHQTGLANALNKICFLLAAVGRHGEGVRVGERA
ncbi:BTAD domain-containing putative transcriptional regulator [Micromonospora sp. NPDC047548]|uniref:BTAD domain-containing putative transcriptional regulator n=1 Tax=Micromonospora sp. NPDC047548 TaxID=3155624 RepID=UPI0033E249AB